MLKSIFALTAVSIIGLSVVACTPTDEQIATYGSMFKK
ncbi:hypothetical protein GGR10_000613 [Bartonella chomelii]|uniref:Lipoprotein n=1 Tax=Bartonella chomelii TaxID=236402 RepID=A0ABR6E2I9_9HYPH|nr:hypothetical protein [Bartonella chomelii]